MSETRRSEAAEFGRRLVSTMDAASVGTNELAEASGMTASHISNYRTGRIIPGIGNLSRIRAALECSWADLLGPDEPLRAGPGHGDVWIVETAAGRDLAVAQVSSGRIRWVCSMGGTVYGATPIRRVCKGKPPERDQEADRLRSAVRRALGREHPCSVPECLTRRSDEPFSGQRVGVCTCAIALRDLAVLAEFGPVNEVEE